jgi:threonine/homoserine/homoserine lactone efflux protein
MWRGSGQSVELPSERAFGVRSPWKSFVLGFLTQISNPKTAVVFASIFAASLPATIPAYMYIVLPPLVFLIEAGWYLVVALLLSSASPQRAYLRMKSPIDRVAGALMGILGLKLIDSAAE